VTEAGVCTFEEVLFFSKVSFYPYGVPVFFCSLFSSQMQL
jgi:hypothetical protein